MLDNILWLIDRWRIMEHPAEDWYRVKQQIQYRIIDKKWHHTPPLKNNFTFNSKVANKYSVENIRKVVNSTFTGIKRFQLLNTVIEDIVSNKNWNYDFKNKIQASYHFIHNINDFDYLSGEVKYIYELSRLYFLPVLAANAISKDDKALLDRTKEILEEWNSQNPFLGTCAWKSGNVVGIRAINLIYYRILLLLSGESEYSETSELLNRLIELHFKFIRSHLSLYSSKGNHHIGELAGLIAISATHSFKNSNALLKQYFDELQSEVLRLIYLDGFNKEQATRYQATYINLFIFATEFSKLEGLQLSQDCKKRLESMYDILNDMRISKSEFFQVGDNDNAELIYPYADMDYNIYESILNDSAILYNKGKHEDYHFDLRNYLLFGDHGFEKYSCAKSRKNTNICKLYHDSGYFLIKDERIQCLYDVGQIGLLPTMAHGHSDILSLSLYINKKPVLVDCGSFQYNTYYKKYRDYFHGVHSHNTISVNHLDQGVIGAGMFWLTNPKVIIEQLCTQSENPFCQASHNGFQRRSLNVIHSRRVEYNKEEREIIIKDKLTSTDRRNAISFYLHFFPSEKVILNGDKICLSDVVISNPLFKDGQLVRGNEDQPLGWYSSRYDAILPTSTFVLKLDLTKTIELHTTIKF
jgi:hypothetical protein